MRRAPVQRTSGASGGSRQIRPDLEYVLTCEHGGNEVPATWQSLFSGATGILQSHRGWDPGALRVAEEMSLLLNTRLFYSKTSRLLIELNRSQGHRSLFSEFTASLSSDERQLIMDRHWAPYRNEVTAHIGSLMQRGSRVVHLSVHSFTPIWESIPRRTSIGLLYDPRRSGERSFCGQWKSALRAAQPDLVYHCNQPYLGKADGFTTSLRLGFSQSDNSCGEYIGIEIEINQALIHPASAAQIRSIAKLLCGSLG